MQGIYGLADWQWWLSGVYFVLLSVGWLWWPGWWVLARTTRLARRTRAVIAPVIGIVLLALVAYGSGSVGMYAAVYVYAGVSLAGAAYGACRYWRRGCGWWREHWRREWVLVVLVVLGLVIQLPAVFGSGLRTAEGARFCFTNNSDGLMHVGFINSLAQGWPPLRPEIDAPLQNYHYFSDLVMAQLVRLGLPSVHVFFQFVPVLLSVLLTGAVYESVRVVTRSRAAAGWTTLVFLLASDGAYWLTFFFPHSHGWEMATLDNGADHFLNMPYAFSKLIFVVAWLVLNHYWRERRRASLELVTGLLVALTLFKVYWWLLLASGWAVVLAWRALVAGGRAWRQGQRGRVLAGAVAADWPEWLALLAGVALGGGLLASVTTSGASQLALVPWVWPRLLTSSDHLGWVELDLRRQVYAQQPSWWRESRDLLEMIGVSVIYVFGARLLALAVNRRSWRLLGAENWLFFLVPAGVWTLVGFNVLQGAGGFNSFNFIIIAAVALLIPLGVNLATWWQGRWSKGLVIVALALLVPRVAHNWWYYLSRTVARDGQLYTSSQLEAWQALRALTAWEEVILVNADSDIFHDASVIPALAGRRTYVSDQAILGTHDVDFAVREQQVREVLAAPDWAALRASARSLGVSYLFLEPGDVERLAFPVASSAAVFRNQAGVIVACD